jgi:hypothetical protein
MQRSFMIETPPAAPSWLELEQVKSLPEVELITNLSEDTLKRRYPRLIVRLSPRRQGMQLKNALAISRGEHASDPL